MWFIFAQQAKSKICKKEIHIDNIHFILSVSNINKYFLPLCPVLSEIATKECFKYATNQACYPENILPSLIDKVKNALTGGYFECFLLTKSKISPALYDYYPKFYNSTKDFLKSNLGDVNIQEVFITSKEKRFGIFIKKKRAN